MLGFPSFAEASAGEKGCFWGRTPYFFSALILL